MSRRVGDTPGGPPAWLERLREQNRDTPSPVPATSPRDLCGDCTFHMVTDTTLRGECRKVAVTTTPWAAFAAQPATTPGAARWQERADAEAQEAAAYRSGERTTCAARQARVGVVG